MKQLKVKDILNIFAKAKSVYELSYEELEELPVYLGDDEELNGIHCAYFCQAVDKNNNSHYDLVCLINENHTNYELEDKAILIS